MFDDWIGSMQYEGYLHGFGCYSHNYQNR